MKPLLYRRRYIPDEIIHLKDDIILSHCEEHIVTKWEVLNPRTDFNNGKSCYYINEGFKVSKFYKNNELIYIYCDIIETIYEDNKIIFNDLLIDVIIENDGFVRVLDLGDIPIALENKLITNKQAIDAINITDKLLSLIYSGKLDELLQPLRWFNVEKLA